MSIIACALATPALADPPTPGTRGAVVADPTVPGPPSASCDVPLFTNQTFDNFDAKTFQYALPNDCVGPVGKIVLSADFSVTAGRQFDRTASIWIGGTFLYFGTTQEPSAAVSPTWHVERDVTDYFSLLVSRHTGRVELGNLVNTTYTGVIKGSAKLTFYRPPALWPDRVRVPDQIVPLATGDGGVANVSGDQALSVTFTPPTNVERVFLDLVAQAQAGDEFWYLCVPDAFADALQSCPGTGYRESEISIDGVRAGVAPVVPWIYTGGIDPGLWRPVPAPQALSFEPWRVDLTPFAAKLNDGHPHTVAVSVFNARDHFSVAANLLLMLDPGRSVVTGAVDANDLVAPAPIVRSEKSTSGGAEITAITVTAKRDYHVSGHVDTSHGRVTTNVAQKIDFSNAQAFTIDATNYRQHLTQATDVTTTTTRNDRGVEVVLTDKRSLPLDIDYRYVTNADATAYQSAFISQTLARDVGVGATGYTARHATSKNFMETTSRLNFDAAGAVVSRSNQAAEQRYTYSDPFGACYDRDVQASDGAVLAVTDGRACATKNNELYSFDAFHNLASLLFGASVGLLP